MKELKIVLFIVLFTNSLFAQYYETPDWFFNIPENEEQIFVIGISDPRMEDSVGFNLATLRALQLAVIINATEISYTSDYFGEGEEVNRDYILREIRQELARFESEAFIKKYTEVYTYRNKNGEAIVLLAIEVDNSGEDGESYRVFGEYFRQDFERSNTRALESVRSISLNSELILDVNKTKTNYRATNVNGTIVPETRVNDSLIQPMGYFYQYYNTLSQGFDISKYEASSDLQKGLWYAYLESIMLGMIKISKNYSVKMGTVKDNYFVDDTGKDTDKTKFYRQVSKNTLNFCLHNLGIFNNQLYASVELAKYQQMQSLKNIDNKKNETKQLPQKRFFLWRWMFKDKFR
ncbi:MAG: hypothetical protein PHF99_01470 [Bacteroidales bacterium]|nr:hypothetical protein [Bacteroidales bacterium]MDD4234664.1 hypothetical protein [Bacteroidales bacterium]